MLKALLSDWDDTLVYTIRVKWAQHREAARSLFNHEISDTLFRKHWGEPMHSLVKNLYQIEETETDQAIAYYHKLAQKYPKDIRPGALELLKSLQELNVDLGVVTAAPMSLLMEDFPRLQFDSINFQHIQTSEDTDFHKPDPRVFTPAVEFFCNQKGYRKDEILYLGDTLDDQVAANQAGLRFLGIPNEEITTASDFDNAGSDYVQDLSQAKQRLLGELH